jgi:acetylornithine deacetylase
MADVDRPDPAVMLERLVGFDTTSRNSNLKLMDMIGRHLAALGVPFSVTTNAAGDKSNIHAVIGPAVDGGLALSGHVDTVPVDGQAWTSDPFRLRAEAGRLYGRGAVDMKGFVACMLATVPDMLALHLARPVHLFLTFDEEITGEGARVLARTLHAGPRPAFCIVGEPTGLAPVIAHKSYFGCTVRVRGRPGHSSLPAQGVNAVFAAAKAVAWLAEEADRLAAEGPFQDGFVPSHTTTHVGPFHGGTVLNMIPELAEFRFEVRALPGIPPDDVLHRLRAHATARLEPAMKAVDPSCGFSFQVTEPMPAFAIAPDHPLVHLVIAASGIGGASKVAYGTEAGIFQQAGLDVVVCGPGSIAQAHQPDEWIARDQLEACAVFLRRALTMHCTA